VTLMRAPKPTKIPAISAIVMKRSTSMVKFGFQSIILICF
jgi:hypothetical protein